MQRWFFPFVAVVALLALAACAAKETAPAAPAPEAKPGSQEQWKTVLEAAKKEGRVVVVGPGGEEGERALTTPFTKKYGIPVEYSGLAGGRFPPRLKAERDAGKYLWDIWVGGTTTFITALKPLGALAPIEPTLILPEVRDPKKWRDGKLHFVEKDKLGLLMTMATQAEVFVNPNVLKPADVKSYRELLEPRWKGKIAAMDPRVPGSGQATFTFFYRHPSLGADFIRALAKQNLALVRDDRQASEWVAQGKYPILIGDSDYNLPFKEQGLPVSEVDPRQVKEGGHLTPSVGSIALFNKAPHPNAAKVFINWVLSKEGQALFAKEADLPSLRADVPWKGVPWRLPQPGFIDTYSEEAMKAKDPLVNLLKELFGS